MNAPRLAPRTWIPLAVGAATAAALGVGLFTIGPLAPKGATTPTAQVSGDASATVAGSPGTTAGAAIDFAFEREAVIDDATALARMANPRTGETWHEPLSRPEYADAFTPLGDPAFYSILSVGERDGHDIVIALRTTLWDYEPDFLHDWGLNAQWGNIEGLYEMHDGVPLLVTCPSARENTPCSALEGGWTYGGGLVAANVFYDSLTPPETVEIASGLRASTISDGDNWDWAFGPRYYGLGWDLMRAYSDPVYADLWATERTTVGSLPGIDVVRVEVPSKISGLTNVFFALDMPYSGLLHLYPPTGSKPTLEEWGGYTGAAAAGRTCDTTYAFSRDTNHVTSDWTLAGTSPEGVDYYTPVEGGNRVSLAVYTRMKDMSEGAYGVLYSSSRPKLARGSSLHSEEVPPYYYDSYEAFLADDAIVAFQWENEDGDWFVIVRREAQHSIYECS